MDYFLAVQEGRRRVKRSVEFLQSVTGPCYPMLFLKVGLADWTPVGDEQLFSTIKRADGSAALVICDSDGNSKAMSVWTTTNAVGNYETELRSRGLVEFTGEVRLPI